MPEPSNPVNIYRANKKKSHALIQHETGVGVVVWFGSLETGTGLKLPTYQTHGKLSDNEPVWYFLLENLFHGWGSEFSMFDNGTVSSVVVPGVHEDELVILSLRQKAVEQNVSCQVRSSEFITKWREDSSLRAW